MATTKTENWTLGTYERAITDGTRDLIKAKALKDGSILVTHTWTFSGMPAGHREAVKDAAAWQRQYDYLRDSGFTRVAAR
jgi:hypothetical protein